MKNAVLLYIDGEFKEYNPISHLLITCWRISRYKVKTLLVESIIT